MCLLCVFGVRVCVCVCVCVCTGPLPDVDVSQLKNGRGVESALLYAKAWSKYTKDLLAWVDKHISLGGSTFLFLLIFSLSLSGCEWMQVYLHV